jgi:single-strand selective monofunctional uracil DNA glycosylase
VSVVYNPLRYAREAHEHYLTRYGAAPKRVVFVGMNPGPWGMAQTGVPFGDVETVRAWLRIDAPVTPPAEQHPSRPVLGLDCPRIEVSGRRLWGLVRDRFGDAPAFFRDHFVANYCPLLFLEASGRNLTPDKLHPASRQELYAACDRHLAETARALQVTWLVGVGSFATSRIRVVVGAAGLRGLRIASIPHPSPASPRANSGWAEQALAALVAQGVWSGRDGRT